ncbi:uncharacterized protein LOC100834976 [Brachypodium distachyon]|uniref:Uncharacterized protein n=1 Tax=Brachypodium distachyon TaxID=15368 RepID=I1IXG8_BRADI|nr:uncharacterized protein LOC100834976 [Brachypodium distachyon]KQJ82493.1 hypothetical protein BRADI_5g09237v3 [Brachypodium distachyon]|eukprot:XP_003579693.1 uncharacterized protein LOC100834976 [Brachypodium distachyon]
MAFLRPCVVACAAAAFLVAAVGAQLMDPGKPDGITWSADVIPIVKPQEQPTVASCYNKANPAQDPICQIEARRCPPGCPDSCYVHCPSCKLVCLCELMNTACYDPRFVGGDGNKFLFHGRRDADFCLLSDTNLHINAHFIGKQNRQAGARDFTWVQALGIRFGGHRLYLGVKRTATWDSAVDRLVITFDGMPVELESSWTHPSAPALSIFRTGAANGVVVRLDGRFRIVANAVPVTEEDSRVHDYGLTAADGSLAHLNVAFKFYSISADVHGVLGQTYRSDYVSAGGVDVGAKIPVMGGTSKYTVSDIFGTDCEVARFAGEEDVKAVVGLIDEPADAMCGSGKGGAGLVCKK